MWNFLPYPSRGLGVGEVTVDINVNEAQLVDEVIVDTNVKLGHRLRTKIPSVKLHDYVLHTIIKKSPSLNFTLPTLSRSSTTPFPIAYYVSLTNLQHNTNFFLRYIYRC